MKSLPVTKIALGALLFGLLPASIPVHADGISISMPGLSISIGSRDNRGYYWDGYDWRSPDWWQNRDNYYGYRNDRGYYWDGRGWRDQGWWNEHRDHRREGPHPQPHFEGGRGGPDYGHGPDRGHDNRDQGGHDNHGQGDNRGQGGHGQGDNHGQGGQGGHGQGGQERIIPPGGPGGNNH
ncbi:MAG: DUF2502 domain-containing protein [Rouxiella aceris]|uniref:DUF2502 domain-containing protein n=1 Tax=Rouxiella aceris TaxID=2703884 RepID=UPI00283B4C05|nr:DUF2502 domain-containing protein [Rouxiella aceris]MDR3431269.1 DUF2502 domain-containing protein [Rouxiella aceris]